MQSRAQWYSIHSSQSASATIDVPIPSQHRLDSFVQSLCPGGCGVVEDCCSYRNLQILTEPKFLQHFFAACFPSIDIRQPSPQLRDPTVSKLPIGECIRLVLAPGPETQQATKMSLWEIKGRGMRTYKLFDAGGKRGAGERAVIT